MPHPEPHRRPSSPAAPGGGVDPREAVVEILRSIRRNLPRVVFTTLVFLMLGLALNMVWPNKFASATEFVLDESRIITDASILRDLEGIPLAAKLAALRNELQSTKRIGAVMDELQWTAWLETTGQPAERRRLVRKVQDNLDVRMTANVKGGINITLAFQWTSPAQAAEFVNRLRDSWIKLVLDGYRKGVDSQREDAEQRKLQREAEFQAALEAKQKYEEEQDVPALLDMEQNANLLREFEVRLTDAKAELQSVVTQIQSLQAELSVLPREVMAPAPAENPEQAEAMAELELAEADFEEAAEKYRAGHWKYDQAQRALDRAKERLEEAGGAPGEEFTSQPNADYVARATDLAKLEAREDELSAQVADLEAQIRRREDNMLRLPRVQADLARYEADVELGKDLLAEAVLALRPLQDHAQALRNAQAVVATGSALLASGPFEILEVGIEPDRPVLPVGAVIMAVSLLMGIGLGLSGPVLSEFTRSSFGSVKEVNRTLGVPVLGAVDLILTARDVRARTVQSVLSIATMALVLLALGTALYMYANHQDRLPYEVLRAIRDLRLALT